MPTLFLITNNKKGAIPSARRKDCRYAASSYAGHSRN